jgi:predicted metalloprotease with PDZ domain
MKNHFSSAFVRMSTTNKNFSLLLIILLEVFLFVFASSAQEIEANIKIKSSLTVAGVEGRFLRAIARQSDKHWWFVGSAAGAENLGARVSDLNLKDKNGGAVVLKKFIDGEYLAGTEANAWSYQINLNPSPNIPAMAHVSWISDEQGILMLDDLLPQFKAVNNQPISAKIKFELPPEWKVISSEKRLDENSFFVSNIEKAIFLVGKNWRERKISIDKTSLNFAASGEWNFSDEEAIKMAVDIFGEYRKLFGEAPTEKAQISLVHFPKQTPFGRWEAETRGANLTVLSSDMPFKALSLQRLHEQLRHELFHLWIPNNLALTGNYDWFYEGFAVYESLKTGLQTNQIRFEDFLATLFEAYNIDNRQTPKVSLIEASKNRWNGLSAQVYSRGMIAAFLCDIALLRASKGKLAISDVFREIYNKHRVPNKPQDGNEAILKILENYRELNLITEKYIKGAEKIDWQTNLESAGIEAAVVNSFTKLTVKTKLDNRQKDLLDKLGYNNWRKIVR